MKVNGANTTTQTIHAIQVAFPPVSLRIVLTLYDQRSLPAIGFLTKLTNEIPLATWEGMKCSRRSPLGPGDYDPKNWSLDH